MLRQERRMRGIFVLTHSILCGGDVAVAQNVAPAGDPTNNPAANSGVGKPTTAAPPQPQPQPQGPTGPTNTTSGGAPATSPQGDTPAGMQPKPQDPKQDVAPKN